MAVLQLFIACSGGALCILHLFLELFRFLAAAIHVREHAALIACELLGQPLALLRSCFQLAGVLLTQGFLGLALFGIFLALLFQPLVTLCQLLLHFIEAARQIFALGMGQLECGIHGLFLLLQAFFALCQFGLQALQRLLQLAGCLFSDFQCLFCEFTRLLQCTAPQGLCGFQHFVGHGIAQLLRLLIQPQACAQCGEPGVQHGGHGIGGAAPHALADFFNRGFLAIGQQGVCGSPDVCLLNATRCFWCYWLHRK